MSYQLLILLFILNINNAYKTCFQESNELNYIFVNNISQINIPLIPLNCIYCQSAYQVDIQLIDEQFDVNRTIQRIKIFLKNFEIEDSSYICLRKTCPIIAEYGSNTILLNINSSLFSHVFLSFQYINKFNNSILCSIQTRFAIYKSIICTKEIYLHPRLNLNLTTEVIISNCRAYLFEKNIYQKSIQFYRTNFLLNNQLTKIKSSNQSCEFIIENTINISLIKTNQLITTVNILPLFNPWNKHIQNLGSCQTKFIPYQEMFFTDDIVNIRNIYIKQGETIQIQCPIDGSKEYLKYIWYYQRYQPKYQISNNRTIILRNISKQMQGKYMCIGNDGNENLEFELTIHFSSSSSNSLSLIIILILLIIFILFSLIIICLIYISFKKSSSLNKTNSFVIHHNVMLTIQQSSLNTLYHTIDYIDDQTSNQFIQQIPYRYSTRHRNVNGQSYPTQISNNDITIPYLVKFNDEYNDIEIFQISSSCHSMISFDSQIELEEFNQMTFVCLDNNSLFIDRQS